MEKYIISKLKIVISVNIKNNQDIITNPIIRDYRETLTEFSLLWTSTFKDCPQIQEKE
jgi:hypothetical protein